MGRGPKPTKGKAKPAVSRKSQENEDSKVRDLEKRLAEALQREAEALQQLQTSHHERAEAQEQQAATAEILRVISSSPTDVQPVFEVVLASGVHLCGASFGGLFRFDGELIHLVTSHEWPAEQLKAVYRRFPMPPGDGSLAARAIRDRQVVQTPDYVAESRAGVLPEWVPEGEQRPRSTIAIPMLREGRPLGAIVLARAEPGLFSDEHVALLQTFADQAVIAIENVRLFNELQTSNRGLTTALDHQTATSEILQVISRSPTDVQPVFDAIAKSALHLCDSSNSVVGRYDGELLHLAAHAQQTSEAAEALRGTFPMRPNRATASGRALLEGCVVHIPKAQVDSEYAQPLAEVIRARAVLAVPMLRDGQPIGTIAVGRLESRPFSDKHIALLQTFADQAVIAIENVRLFNETKEALERQTATSEILRVISSSPTDVDPVFRTILANANRLCDASFSVLWLWDGEAPTAVAHENVSPAMAEALRTARPLPSRRWPLGLSVLEQTVVHVADVLTDSRFTPEDVPSYRLEGARSILCVPMVRKGSLVGLINLWRREPRAFTDGQIALVRTFADQAVIAIENVRLFTELQEKNRAVTRAHAQVSESLEQQTATSEILGVIASSPTDVQPVFDTIADSVMRLCDAWSVAVYPFDGELVHVTAARGGLPDSANFLKERFPMRPTPDAPDMVVRAIVERTVVHVPDSELADRPRPREIARARGFRAAIVVPMLRGGEPIGAIGVSRAELGAFSPAQIEMLQTFAALVH